MKHLVKSMALAAASLALTVSFAVAQTTPKPSGAPSAPADSGLRQAPSPAPSVSVTKVIDGPVKDVDPAAKTVEVGWLLGFFSTTLEVTDDTHIAVDGEKGSLDRIHEGDQVKASYEARDGKNLAKAIEVIQPEKESMSSKAAPPAMESPRRSAEPPSGESPKAP
jgi:Cu/Ag efflux protein CusF